MAKFEVWAKVVGTKFLGEYEADTKDQAIELAMKESGHVSLCWQCSREIDDPEIEDTTAEEITT